MRPRHSRLDGDTPRRSFKIVASIWDDHQEWGIESGNPSTGDAQWLSGCLNQWALTNAGRNGVTDPDILVTDPDRGWLTGYDMRHNVPMGYTRERERAHRFSIDHGLAICATRPGYTMEVDNVITAGGHDHESLAD